MLFAAPASVAEESNSAARFAVLVMVALVGIAVWLGRDVSQFIRSSLANICAVLLVGAFFGFSSELHRAFLDGVVAPSVSAIQRSIGPSLLDDRAMDVLKVVLGGAFWGMVFSAWSVFQSVFFLGIAEGGHVAGGYSRWSRAAAWWAVATTGMVFLSFTSDAGLAGSVILATSAGITAFLLIPILVMPFHRAGAILNLALVELAGSWPYLRALILPSVGFGITYSVVVTEFAAAYTLIYRSDPDGAFGIDSLAGAPLFGDFLFFSLSTITTLGYSPLTPRSSAAQVLTGIEVVTGIALLTVGFAAVLAYLDNRFARIGSRQAQAAPEQMAKLRDDVSALTKLVAAEHNAAKERQSELRAELASIRRQQVTSPIKRLCSWLLSDRR